MSGESRKKVDLKKLVDELIAEVKVIDADDSLNRSEKTKLITRAATKFKNKLHDDGRKKDDARIALGTYRKYMTQARAEVTAQNWKHHSLGQQIERLSKKYPQFADAFLKMNEKYHITDIRLAHRDLLNSIKDNNEAYEDIKGMKLDHEVMRHLTVASAQKAKLADQAAESLEYKKHSTVEINYHQLLASVVDLLTKKTKTVGSDSAYSFSRLALGIGFATGRRSVEILKQGEFKVLDKQRMEFSGQAKKRGGADYSDSYTIYTLVDANLVMQAIEQMRQLPEVVALDDFDELPEVKRNDAINKRCAKTLNTTAKQFFDDNERVFKDSRAIWARLVYELFFKRDKRWAKKDEDVFWQEMLGHEDMETQKAYKQFKINYDEPEATAAEPVKFKTRLEAMMALDEEMAERPALLKIHDWAKGRLKQDPNATINQSVITREIGSGRKVIKDYLDLTADALAVTNVEVTVAPVPAKSARQDKTEPADGAGVKPFLKAQKVDDEHYEAVALVNGEEVARVKIKGGRVEAMTAALEAFKKSSAVGRH
jgi:hypothetical protein